MKIYEENLKFKYLVHLNTRQNPFLILYYNAIKIKLVLVLNFLLFGRQERNLLKFSQTERTPDKK